MIDSGTVRAAETIKIGHADLLNMPTDLRDTLEYLTVTVGLEGVTVWSMAGPDAIWIEIEPATPCVTSLPEIISPSRSRFGMLSDAEVQIVDAYCSPIPVGLMKVDATAVTPAWGEAVARAQHLIENLSPASRARVDRGMARYDAEHGADS